MCPERKKARIDSGLNLQFGKLLGVCDLVVAIMLYPGSSQPRQTMLINSSLPV